MHDPKPTSPLGGEDAEPSETRIAGVRRPDSRLMTYWTLFSFVLGPFFFVLLIPFFFKYKTLRYEFDEEGVSASWGALFRREISLNYSRIQDIHLASNFVERRLGLARIQIQTASGSSGAEMTVEGLLEYQEVRDWLYSRMRGAKGRTSRVRTVSSPSASSPPAPSVSAAAGGDELAATLQEVAAEMRRIRELLETKENAT